MKKLLIAAILTASTVSATAFAASVPVTKIGEGHATVAAEYSFAQKGSDNNGSNNDGFGASLNAGLSDDVNLGYSYSKVNLKHSDLKDHQAGITFALSPHLNVYGVGTYVKGFGDHDYGVQGGLIGYMPLTDKIQGFAKVGVGDDIKNTYQAGVTYGLTPDLGLNVYYQYDKYDLDGWRTDRSVKGVHAGVGYSF